MAFRYFLYKRITSCENLDKNLNVSSTFTIMNFSGLNTLQWLSLTEFFLTDNDLNKKYKGL